ncbi:hypothetical protein DRN67_00570 [Candidatus Micrarchaeota archaeon]|nr:MAG: hypothetical protein DRN67_00570 [Candidatus Micrarchaeota archaeon]
MEARKGQAALEFLLLAAFFLFIFLLLTGYFASLQRSQIVDREYLLASEVTSRIAYEVHAALLAGPGYEKSFVLPSTLGTSEYELRITNYDEFATAYAEVRWTKGGTEYEYSSPLASRNLWTGSTPILDANPLTLDPDEKINIKRVELLPGETGNGGKIEFTQ